MKPNHAFDAFSPSCWCMVLLILGLAGCSTKAPISNSNQAQAKDGRRTPLSASAAAELAAKLANDECERHYGKRPFAPAQHAAVLEGEQYRWGGLDIGGVGGLSALVTFAVDGTNPKVEVYYSSDQLSGPAGLRR
ncbi:MAG TPA: hypothetical protein VNU68_31120 [Verrucomicrobiae bacterium]|nr:hypothetical protein [Verrucomicrobiae bacterium]